MLYPASDVAAKVGRQGPSVPGRALYRVPLVRSENPEESNTELLSGLRKAFLKILNHYCPVKF